MPNKKETIIFASLAILIVLIIILASYSTSETKITGMVTDGFEEYWVTGYYIPVERDFAKWWGGYGGTSGKAACNWQNPGFYEAILCEGSGYTNDNYLCTYQNIPTDRNQYKTKCTPQKSGKPVPATGARGNLIPGATVAGDPNKFKIGKDTIMIEFGDAGCLKKWSLHRI